PSSWVERQSRWLPEPTLLQLIFKIRILACLPSINLSLNDEDLHHAIATCSHHPLDPTDCGNDFAHRLCWKIKPFASFHGTSACQPATRHNHYCFTRRHLWAVF